MEQSIVYRIVRKYLSNRFTTDTEEKTQKWMMKEKYTEEKERASLDYWTELPQETHTDTRPALQRVNRRISYASIRTLSLYHKIARIAAILLPLCILAGGYWHYNSESGNLIEVSVAYGEKKHILLPDSSEIWLNAGTVFRYPKDFADDQRLVYLDGEAYFTVRRDAARPFIVQAPQMSVKVLGTRFNVKAYSDDETITTTLTSGKVEVNTSQQKPQLLKPNEQLTYNRKTSQLSITQIPEADTDSWMTGKLIFTNASFTDIQQTLERRYNIVIKNATGKPATARYTVRFLQNEDLEGVLNVLGTIIGFDYQRTGNNIVLTSKP